MRPLSHSSSIEQSAAFALFEALRQAQGLAAAPDGSCRATYLCAVDPAVAGLAWASTDDDALKLRWSDAPLGFGEHLWVHAACEARGPVLGLYLQRDRPALVLRFGGASFVDRGDGRYLLRERATHPSHDGRHAERDAMTRRLAAAWRVPMEGSWLHVGHWNALEAAWEPEACRRLLAVTLIIEAARHLDAEWVEA